MQRKGPVAADLRITVVVFADALDAGPYGWFKTEAIFVNENVTNRRGRPFVSPGAKTRIDERRV